MILRKSFEYAEWLLKNNVLSLLFIMICLKTDAMLQGFAPLRFPFDHIPFLVFSYIILLGEIIIEKLSSSCE